MMRNYKRYLIVPLFAAAFFSSYIVTRQAVPLDDAYITYAYAKRLAMGYGFTFSPGALPTYGTTTPLYTLMLSLICKIGILPHVASPWINVISHGLIAVLLFWIGRYLLGTLTGLLMVLVWVLQFSVFFSSSGMETPYYMVLFLSVVILLLLEKKTWIIGVLLGITLLTRPDTLLLILSIACFWLLDMRRRKTLPLLLLIVFVVYLPWVLYAFTQFGSIVPTSMKAKIINPGKISGNFGLEHFITYFLPISLTDRKSNLSVFVVLFIFFVIGCFYLWKNRLSLRAVIVWIPLYCSAMRLGGAPDFRWYYIPPWVVALIPLVIGFVVFLRRLKKFSIPLPIILIVILVFVIATANVKSLHWYAISPHKQLALIVKQLAKPGDLVASREVGNLTYWAELPVLDMLGLNSPEVTPFLKKNDMKGILEKYKPEFVLYPGNKELFEDYEPIESLPYGTDTYTIWRRRTSDFN